jgi:hypothetical protein
MRELLVIGAVVMAFLATPFVLAVPAAAFGGDDPPSLSPHRVAIRHRVTYHVETRGRIVADLEVFKKQAQVTYDDHRGWRRSGISFRRVPRGGSFTLVLSAAGRMTSFSSSCSAQWSCRVGRYVIINQARWLHASPLWHRVGGTRRDYRHMVVNHETGHWLGHDHRGCPAQGARAPVMQTQSKGLDGCRPNPWPTRPELRVPRFS